MSILSARLNPNEVVQVYTQTAPVYDLWGWLTETNARSRALARAQIQDGERVLEVAVGTGLTFQEILKAISPRSWSVSGASLSPAGALSW